MFDKLIESTKHQEGRRAGNYFVATALIYGLALVCMAVGAIIGFSPVLAEEYSFEAMLAPPPLQMTPAPPPLTHQMTREPQTISFTPPTNPIDLSRIRRAEDLPVRIGHSGPGVIGAPIGNLSGSSAGILGGPITGEGAPPPPPPLVKPSPTPVSEIKSQGAPKISEGVLQGGAIRKIKPSYPAMARSIRANGPVQVLVTISEDGRVTDAQALSGHPMLRNAAVEAARQWLFSPTKLSNIPVKVQGVLTFNFILE